MLASATWALEALVGELLPPAARREPGVGCCRSYYTLGGLGAFGLSRRAGVKLPGLRQRPRLLHAPVVYGILREFLGAVQLPSDAASARALWTRPSPVVERIGLARAPAPEAAGLPPAAPAVQAELGLALVQTPSPLGGPAALGDNEQPAPAWGGAVRAKPRRRGAATGGAAERPAAPNVDARAPGGAPRIVK